VPQVPGIDRGLVGTAVGYLLSAHLRPDALDHTIATGWIDPDAETWLDGQCSVEALLASKP
jgi:hypothetical protein